MQKNKIKRKEATDSSVSAYIKRCVIFILIFCIVTFICTTVIAFLFYNLNDPTSLSGLCAEISLYLSLTICTCMFLKGIGDKKIIWGFIYGAALLLFLYIFSLLPGNSFESPHKTVLRVTMPFFSAFIGLLLRVTWTKDKKRRKRRT